MNKFWTWRGRDLANPLTIIRRLIFWPFYILSRTLLTIVVLAAWGWDDAVRIWGDTA